MESFAERSRNNIRDIDFFLESQGWAVCEEFLPGDLCQRLLPFFLYHLDQGYFEISKIGQAHQSFGQMKIRNSQNSWINNWDYSSELKDLQSIFNELQFHLNRQFRLSLKRFESQFAFYPENGFYKKHLDQLQGRGHRQVTCTLYLNDCDQGGELVIYNRGDEKANFIKPRFGMAVFFFSSQIYHEVLPTKDPRYSLTTWFRDDHAFS